LKHAPIASEADIQAFQHRLSYATTLIQEWKEYYYIRRRDSNTGGHLHYFVDNRTAYFGSGWEDATTMLHPFAESVDGKTITVYLPESAWHVAKMALDTERNFYAMQ
jgi:hypothetical protein